MLSEDAILYYADNPVHFVEDIIHAKPDKAQSQILQSLAENQMTSVRSGHGIGKSAVEAWAILWFMTTRPFPKIPCTAPTQHQLFDILWAEVSKWLRNNEELSKSFVWTRGKLYLKGYPEEWFAVARTAANPDALQGFHAEHVLYIIDEASGISDGIFEPVLGSLSTSGARLLMCGNPTQLSGFFFDSHHKNRVSYKTIHVDGRDSELVSQDFIDTIVGMYGEDSNVFRVRVAGEFPLQEDDVFIPLSLVERSVLTEYEKNETPDIIRIGCDVARFGSDKTVISTRVDHKIKFNRRSRGQDTMETAARIIQCGEELIEKYPEYHAQIPVCVDDSGVGGGVTDRLRQIRRGDPNRFWWLYIIPAHFGQRIKHRNYHDSTTFWFACLRALLSPDEGEPEIVLPNDEALIAQLSCRKYGLTEQSKIKIESKEDMKKRGLPSPDEADSVLLLTLPIKLKGVSSLYGPETDS
ncbi:MAG: terminase [Oscillospiraceae bacterium]|jgi:hypothetical protein|nr:terminase [Oscillospiraceae bacterium]